MVKSKLNWLHTDIEIWFHFGVLLNLVAINLGQKFIHFERKIVSCSCGKKESNLPEYYWKDSFTSTSTNKLYKINHLFNCGEKRLVYLLTCQTCFKQYIDQTVEESLNWMIESI